MILGIICIHRTVGGQDPAIDQSLRPSNLKCPMLPAANREYAYLALCLDRVSCANRRWSSGARGIQGCRISPHEPRPVYLSWRKHISCPPNIINRVSDSPSGLCSRNMFLPEWPIYGSETPHGAPPVPPPSSLVFALEQVSRITHQSLTKAMASPA